MMRESPVAGPPQRKSRLGEGTAWGSGRGLDSMSPVGVGLALAASGAGNGLEVTDIVKNGPVARTGRSTHQPPTGAVPTGAMTGCRLSTAMAEFASQLTEFWQGKTRRHAEESERHDCRGQGHGTQPAAWCTRVISEPHLPPTQHARYADQSI